MSLKLVGIFLTGTVMGSLSTWQIAKFLSSSLRVYGIVHKQEKVEYDSYPPPPAGYYVLSPIYLQYDVPEWVGKEVNIDGRLGRISNLSGKYPMITSIERLYIKGIKTGAVQVLPPKTDLEAMKHRWIGEPK